MADLPYETNFPNQPAFPEDVPTAAIQRISLQALIDNDAHETSRLLSACTGSGFFYLDLRDAHGSGLLSSLPPPPSSSSPQPSSLSLSSSTTTTTNTTTTPTPPPISGPAYLSLVSSLFSAAPSIFATPSTTKAALDFAARGSYYGFKPLGAGPVDGSGTRDSNEFFNVSKDDLLGLAEREPFPAEAESFRAVMAEFVAQSHAIGSVLLGRLEKGLGWAEGALTQRHRLGQRSGDQVRFVRAPGMDATRGEEERKRDEELQRLEKRSDVSLGAHTDFGSVTLLHNRLGGLQIVPGDETFDGKTDAKWEYVRPLPGHCVVNLGDAMVKFSAGKLMSGLHRVVRPPGEQRSEERLSVVYFGRPEDDVLLKSLVGGPQSDEEHITAKEWTLRRALGRRGVGSYEQSGGTEVRQGSGRVLNGQAPAAVGQVQAVS